MRYNYRLEWEAFLAAVNEGDYELAILGRGVEADPDLSYHWHSESLGNALGYKMKKLICYWNKHRD